MFHILAFGWIEFSGRGSIISVPIKKVKTIRVTGSISKQSKINEANYGKKVF